MNPSVNIPDLELGIRAFSQLAVILLTCRAFGYIGKRFLGQTQVVSEMIAGVFLGPSVLQQWFPQIEAWIFPKTYLVHDVAVKNPSMQVLYVASQFGLALYMFLVGVEFDFRLLGKQKGAGVLVSMSGIAAPFLLGALLALQVSGDPDFFKPGVSQTNAILYFGAAMCITAFPMLARIIVEKGLSKTEMGTLALGAGAFDDVFAWTLLAVVLAATRNDAMIGIKAIGGGILYAAFILTAGKRFFAYLEAQVVKEGKLSDNVFVFILSILMFCSWLTDAIGIYAVFGAFFAGAAITKNGPLAIALREKIEPLTVNMLLPLFFVYSGLNTQIGLINSTALWGITLLVMFAAMAGKGGACTLAAKVSGRTWHESIAIGTLMNARGLMELIILNIGREKGVISDTLFTIMVLMAVVTTLIASPLFEWIYGKRVPKIPLDESSGPWATEA